MGELNVRQPVFAGSFYPEDAEELRSLVKGYISDAKVSPGKCSLVGLVSPHAAFQYSGPIAGYSYHVLRDCLADCNGLLKVIMLGPTHQEWLDGIALPEADVWRTPLGDVKICKKGCEFFLKQKNCVQSDKAHTLEHSLEAQLPFLQVALEGRDFTILPMLVSEVNISKTVDLLEEVIDDNTLVIASADLSHYRTYDEAVPTDKNTIGAILELDTGKLREDGDTCGMTPLHLLVELSIRRHWKPTLADYRNSGDITGSKAMVVGYASIYFTSK